jgi:hypothetical protein
MKEGRGKLRPFPFGGRMSEQNRVETVRVVSPVSAGNPHGYIVINKSDLTEAHKLFATPVAVPKTPKSAPSPRRDVFVDGKE